MAVEIKVMKDNYIYLTLDDKGDTVGCGADYSGTPEELVAMLAYAVKNIADDMHIKHEALTATLLDTIKLMNEEEIEK